jgi:alpha-galactosidase
MSLARQWVMRPPSNGSRLFRMHDEKARRWLTDLIDRHITEAKLDWVRWDFNIEPLGFWMRNDTPDRQGITEIRHIEGLHAMWDALRTRHPGLMIDNCASGGRRIDLETCSRSVRCGTATSIVSRNTASQPNRHRTPACGDGYHCTERLLSATNPRTHSAAQ